MIAIEISHGCTVSVDLTAHSDGREQLVPHHLVSLVLGHVNREEASVSLRESRFVHAPAQRDRMLLLQALNVDWQAGATPDELQVRLPLVVIVGSHDSPEALDDWAALSTALIIRNFLQPVDLERLLSASSRLNLLPVHELNKRHERLSEHLFHAFTHGFNLLSRLIEACLHHQVDILGQVFASNCLDFLTWLQINFFTV